jgi:hypothetical protein
VAKLQAFSALWKTEKGRKYSRRIGESENPWEKLGTLLLGWRKSVVC